jgi:uncharacterized protein (TIGR00725 family)
VSFFKSRSPVLRSRIPVAVIGSATPKQGSIEFATARELGRELAKAGLIVACGGRTGIMEAVSLGCGEAGGISIGILPRLDSRANPHCSIVLLTDLGDAHDPIAPEISRNRVLILGAPCVFAVSGRTGTANELGFALEHKKRVFGLCNPPEPEGHAGPSVWNAPGSGFTRHESVAEAMSAFAKFGLPREG